MPSNAVPKRIEVSELFAAAEAVEQEQGVKEDSQLTTETFLGTWVDSLGNLVSVYNTDAFETKLMATLSRAPRADIHLALRRVATSGWRCGNAVLDPLWSTDRQLHWLSENGRVSVWVKADDVKPSTSQAKGQAKGQTKGQPSAAATAATAPEVQVGDSQQDELKAKGQPNEQPSVTTAADAAPEVQKEEQGGEVKEATAANADEATASGST